MLYFLQVHPELRSEQTTTSRSPDTRRSFKILMHRLSKAGFSREFVQRAILPDWWEEPCSDDPRLVQDFEIRIARFLGRPVKAVIDRGGTLEPPPYPGAQLRRTRGADRGRLAPAMHAAIRIATATVRNLRDTVSPPQDLPRDGLQWRDLIMANHQAPTLSAIVEDLWQLGIPVVPLDLLPGTSFQGMACIVEDRPVVLLGHKHDEPGRVAFIVAHEAGHIAAGDCAPGQPVVDERDEIVDDVEIERSADRYATHVLVGHSAEQQPDDVGSMHFKELARHADTIARNTGADASFVIFSWARQTGDYATAKMAVKALYRDTGARKQLRQLFDRHVDFTTATETDRSLLLCVHGDSVRHEAAL